MLPGVRPTRHSGNIGVLGEDAEMEKRQCLFLFPRQGADIRVGSIVLFDQQIGQLFIEAFIARADIGLLVDRIAPPFDRYCQGLAGLNGKAIHDVVDDPPEH